jgi:ribosomal protein S18 acetylase RimI-like enzyme
MARSCHHPPTGTDQAGGAAIGQDGLVTRSEKAVRIRVARADDDGSLAALSATAWSAESGFPSVAQRVAESFFSPESPPEAHLVCEVDDTLAGYIRLRPATPLPENAHVIGVFGLAVGPAARRRGAGSALLAAAEDFARARGARKLSLRVFSTNAAAIRLYERFGFQREGLLREEFLINGEYVDDVLMTKYLT